MNSLNMTDDISPICLLPQIITINHNQYIYIYKTKKKLEEKHRVTKKPVCNHINQPTKSYKIKSAGINNVIINVSK